MARDITGGVAIAGDTTINNKEVVVYETGTDIAPLNLPILLADPSSPIDGDVWIYWDGATTVRLKARINGVTYSAALT